MRKFTLCIAAGILSAACLVGCADRAAQQGVAEEPAAQVKAAVMTADAGIRETVLFADPAGAVDAIYKSLSTEPSLDEVALSEVEAVYNISPSKVVEVVACVSDAKSGLSEVAVILPKEGQADSVREALNQYRTLRAEEFKNYDILGAYSIASGATVFNQGDYVVMLMLDNNEAAQEILDQYMPK